MKISRAIKNLEAGRKDAGMISPEDYTPTIDLAIEGLKNLKRICDGLNIMIWKVPLPKKYKGKETEWPLFWVAELADNNLYVRWENDEFVPALKVETEKQLAKGR